MSCIDENGSKVSLYVGYTNLDKASLDKEQREAMPCFNYKDLVEVHNIIEGLKKV